MRKTSFRFQIAPNVVDGDEFRFGKYGSVLVAWIQVQRSRVIARCDTDRRHGRVRHAHLHFNVSPRFVGSCLVHVSFSDFDAQITGRQHPNRHFQIARVVQRQPSVVDRNHVVRVYVTFHLNHFFSVVCHRTERRFDVERNTFRPMCVCIFSFAREFTVFFQHTIERRKRTFVERVRFHQPPLISVTATVGTIDKRPIEISTFV